MTLDREPLRVAIDGRFVPGRGGGVESVVIGLAQGFASLADPSLEITFVSYRGANDWLADFGDLFKNVETPIPGRMQKAVRRSRIWAMRSAERSISYTPRHDRVMESVPVHVFHFPLQGAGFVRRRPYIYHPHDLQHRHLPGFFTSHERAAREIVYASHLRRARAVAVGTSWVKNDLIEQMMVSEDKIFVVPLAPINGGLESGHGVIVAGLPEKFVVYPAASWPHKNHERLFAALALLKRQGLLVNLVLTGSRRPIGDLGEQARLAGVDDLVLDRGYTSQAEVEFLIQRAHGMVVPTLFEAASFPIWESFRLRTPVACSTVTSLPRQVGDAALTFDPFSVSSIANAVAELWNAPVQKRDQLVELGTQRLEQLSWRRTAAHFHALYRRLAGRPESEEDVRVLAAEPML